jgi:hypothetical protein
MSNKQKNIMNKKDEVKLDDSKTNGLITKIWGPHFWETLHCVSFGYPLEPTEQNKKDYKEFFVSVRNVLPCKYCRESYSSFILTENRTKLTYEDLENRESLTKYVYKLHQRVNEKLGMFYDVKYDDIVKRYESYRAICVAKAKSCNMPLNLKARSYQHAEVKHAVVMDVEFFDRMKKYAELRGVIFDDGIKKLKTITDRNDERWLFRDKFCWKLINKMRKEGLPSVELEGEYKNLPTINELKLIQMLCTNICCQELNIICNNIDHLINEKN